MNVELYERLIADAFEAVDLAGFDDEYVAATRLELLVVHHPEAPAGLNKLYLVVRVAVRAGSAARKPVEKEDGDIHVTVVGSNEVMRAAAKRQFFLTYTVHAGNAPVGVEKVTRVVANGGT